MALVVAICIPGALQVSTLNSSSDFFIDGQPETTRYERFLGQFGSDEVIRVVTDASTSLTRDGLDALGRLETEVATWPGVSGVLGLRGHHEPAELSWPPDDVARFAASVQANRLDRQLGLISRDDRLVTTLVVLHRDDLELERAVLARLEQRVAALPAALRASLIGVPLLDRAMDHSAREVTNRFFPLLIAVALVILGLVFRQLKAVLLPLLLVGLVELVLFGLLGYSHTRLNLLLAIVPPLVFTVALATSIHLLLRFRDVEATQRHTAHEATIATFVEKGRAVVYGVANTMAGCGSLVTSLVGPVRQLGIWSTVGVALLGVIVLIAYPALLATSGSPLLAAGGAEQRFERAVGQRARRLTEWCAWHRWRIVAAALVIATVALVGLPRLRPQSNALSYLAESHPVRASIDRLERAGVGVSTAELVIETPRLGEQLEQLSRLSEQLGGLPTVLSVVGAGDLIDDLANSMFPTGAAGTTLNPRAVALHALRDDPHGAKALASFLVPAEDATRVTVFAKTSGRDDSQRLYEQITAAARHQFPRATVTVTGRDPLLIATQGYLLETLLTSFGSAIAVIFIGFWLLLRSGRLALVALVPNVLPVVVVFGAMAWIGVPLDVGTAMVASIVLGLAVDDTIHTMSHFRELARVHGRDRAIAGTLEATAPAYLLTGAILVLGFGILVFSDFLPTARFGALCATSVAVAVIAELLLVPALFSLIPEHSITARPNE